MIASNSSRVVGDPCIRCGGVMRYVRGMSCVYCSYERHAARKKTPEYKAYARRHLLWKLYRITPEQFDTIFNAQGRSCACCKAKSPGGGKDWCVDHCHKTGKLRGIVCGSCNNGFGRFKDDIRLLEAAISYLRDAGRTVQAVLSSFVDETIHAGTIVRHKADIRSRLGTVVSVSARKNKSGVRHPRAKVLWTGMIAADYEFIADLIFVSQDGPKLGAQSVNGVYRKGAVA